MSDHLIINGVTVKTRIGVPAEERREPQEIVLSLDLTLDVSDVVRADDPAAGVDYAAVVTGVTALAGEERKTIERLAEDVAAYILQAFAVREVSVTVTKHPPLPSVRDVQLSIIRSRPSKHPLPMGRMIA